MALQAGNSLYWKTGIDTAGLTAGVTRAKGILTGFAGSISKMDIFAGLALAATAVFTQISRMSYKMAKDFEHAMKEVQTISGEAQRDFEGVSKAVIEMSRTVPDSATGLSKALYQIVSAGYDGAKAMDLLKSSSELAVAGVSDTKTAADALTYVMNAFGESAGSADEIAGMLFETVKLGKTTLDEIGPAVSHVAGLWAQAGGTFKDLMATFATGVQRLPTEMMTTGIRGMIGALISPSQEAIELTKELGVEFSTTALQAKGFYGMLTDLMDATDGNIDMLGKLFPNVRALVGLLGVATESGEQYAKSLNAMATGTEDMKRAFKIMVNDTTNQIAILGNNISAKLMPLGTRIVGAMGDVVGFINDTLFEARSGVEKMADVWDGLGDTLYEKKKIIDDLSESIKKLADKEKLSKVEAEQYASAKRELGAYLPEFNRALDETKSIYDALNVAKKESERLSGAITEASKVEVEWRTKAAKLELDMINKGQAAEVQRAKTTADALEQRKREMEQTAREIQTFMQTGKTPMKIERGTMGPVVTPERTEEFRRRMQMMGVETKNLTADTFDLLAVTQQLIDTDTEMLTLSRENANAQLALAEHTRQTTEEYAKFINVVRELSPDDQKAQIKAVDDMVKAYEKQIRATKDVREINKMMSEFRTQLGDMAIKYKLFPEIVLKVNEALQNIKLPDLSKTTTGDGRNWLKEVEDLLEQHKDIVFTYGERRAKIEAYFNELITNTKKKDYKVRLGDLKEYFLKELEETEKKTGLVQSKEILQNKFLEQQEIRRKESRVRMAGEGDAQVLNLQKDFFKDTNRMSLDELRGYEKILQKKLDAVRDFKDKAEIVYDELKDTQEKIWEKEKKRIDDIAGSLSDLSSMVGHFDEELARTISDASELVRSVGELSTALKTPTDKWGVFVAATAVMAGVIDLVAGLTKAQTQLMTATEQLTRQFERQDKVLQNLYGAERLTMMQRYTDAIERQLLDKKADLENLEKWYAENYYGKLKGDSAEVRALIDQYFQFQNELTEELTGTTREGIADAITQGFREGLRGVQDFGQKVNEILATAIAGAFTRSIDKEIGAFYEKFVQASEGGFQEITLAQLKEQFNQVIAGSQEAWDEFVAMAREAGIELVDTVAEAGNEAFQTLKDSILSAMEQGFLEGKDIFEMGPRIFEDAMRQALLNVFRDKVLFGKMEGFYGEFIDKLQEGTATTLDINRFKWGLASVLDEAGDLWKEISDIAEQAGIHLSEGLEAVTENRFSGLGDQLGDSLIEAFRAGGTGLADQVDKIMQQVVLDSFRNKIIGGKLDAFFEEFSRKSEKGLTEPLLAELRAQLVGVVYESRTLWQEFVDLAEDAGIDIMETTQEAAEESFDTLRDTITDALLEGMRRGETAVQQFGDLFSDVVRTALYDQFRESVMSKYFENWYKTFSETMEGGVTSREANQLKSEFATALRGAQAEWDALGQIASQLGISIADQIPKEEPQGLTGAIRGIQEETAGLLAGQFQNLLLNTKSMMISVSSLSGMVQSMVEHTAMIAANTSANPLMLSQLEQIKNYLTPTAGQDSWVRATGG